MLAMYKVSTHCRVLVSFVRFYMSQMQTLDVCIRMHA